MRFMISSVYSKKRQKEAAVRDIRTENTVAIANKYLTFSNMTRAVGGKETIGKDNGESK